MSSLLPFLIVFADKRCDPPSPVASSSALVRHLAQNQVLLRDHTKADGNSQDVVGFLIICFVVYMWNICLVEYMFNEKDMRSIIFNS